MDASNWLGIGIIIGAAAVGLLVGIIVLVKKLQDTNRDIRKNTSEIARLKLGEVMHKLEDMVEYIRKNASDIAKLKAGIK